MDLQKCKVCGGDLEIQESKTTCICKACKAIADKFKIENGVLLKYKGSDADVVIPNCVSIIGKNAFKNCDYLSNVTIPDSVVIIEEYAFSCCESLKSITIPNGVTKIGELAFLCCTSLASVTIPSSVTRLGTALFCGCERLKTITVDEENQFYRSIDGNLYTKDGTALLQYATGKEDTSFVISSNVISIREREFNGNKHLENIMVDKENKVYQSIDGNLYTDDGKTLLRYAPGKKDTSFIIPNTVTCICSGAFNGCKNLASVTIPNSVTNMEDAFAHCTGLTSVTIPNSITTINNTDFMGCTSLKSITIPDSVTSIGTYAFSGCINLTSVVIPNSVTSIGECAFEGCKSLTSVTIPNSVKDISNYAFEYCTKLTSIAIPRSVTIIGTGAFLCCKFVEERQNNNVCVYCGGKFKWPFKKTCRSCGRKKSY